MKITFGKYKGKSLYEIAKIDYPYIEYIKGLKADINRLKRLQKTLDDILSEPMYKEEYYRIYQHRIDNAVKDCSAVAKEYTIIDFFNEWNSEINLEISN